MSSGNENPAISRQMRNEKRPRNGRHFAIHQLSSTHVAADAYVPMTIAHAPYPNTANTIETEANVSATAGPMMTRRLNWNVRCISASGTLEHECSSIIPEFAAAIRPTRESWKSAPISGEATRLRRPEQQARHAGHDQHRVGGILDVALALDERMVEAALGEQRR